MTWPILRRSRSFLPSDVIDELAIRRYQGVGLDPRDSYMQKNPDFEALDPMLGTILVDDLGTCCIADRVASRSGKL